MSTEKKHTPPKDSRAEYQVWVEGYLVTGMEGKPAPARCVGTFLAVDFAAACRMYVKTLSWRDKELIKYDGERPISFWGCRFFDNAADAQKSFG